MQDELEPIPQRSSTLTPHVFCTVQRDERPSKSVFDPNDASSGVQIL